MSVTTAENAPKLSIAVNDLIGNGIEQSTAAILSDRLRSELLNTAMFAVMERNQMDMILKEQGFQQSGACDESSCLVEVGQLLGVQCMVAGSIGKIDSLYALNLRMIDITTGQIIFTVNEDCEGEIKGVLTQTTINVARKLAEGASEVMRKAALHDAYGDLYIVSDPPGASVAIDGKPVEGVTPLMLKAVQAGERTISLTKDSLCGVQTVSLAPNDLLKIDVPLEKEAGILKVISSPDGAVVRIDGVVTGETPCKIVGVAFGNHILEISKEGYLPYKDSINVTSKATGVNTVLKNAAWITMNIDHTKAIVAVNETVIGNADIIKYPVAAGEVKLKVITEDYDKWLKTVSLAPGEHDTIDVDLVFKAGTLSVASTPMDAEVFLNKKRVGTTPFVANRLKPGNYTLEVTRATYATYEENITILKDTILMRFLTLQHSRVYLDSLDKAHVTKKRRRRWARRIVFGSGAVIAGSVGLYYNSKVRESYERQCDYIEDYDRATTQDEADSARNGYKEERLKNDKNVFIRNGLYSLAGVFLAGFTISVFF